MEKKPRSFLIINPFGIGDVLFSTPLIRNLHDKYPEAKLYYLCNERSESILKTHPLIHRFFVYERDAFEDPKLSKAEWLRQYWKFIQSIRREKIDVAIDLSLNTKYGFFCWAAGIRERIGFNYRKRGRFLTKKIFLDGFSGKHVASHYLDVLKLLDIPVNPGTLEVFSDPGSREWVRGYFREKGIGEHDLIIGIAPCGGWAFGPNAFMKRWPELSFAELISRLQRQHPAKIFLFAGPNEKNEIQNILEHVYDRSRCFEFTDTTLEEMIALIERVDLFIGNDTGPLRFADALNKKIGAFFGPVDEKVYGMYPYVPDRHLYFTRQEPCRPCYQKFKLPPCPYDIKCLKNIPVDEVYQKVEAFINE